jgi:hypothetical protein
MPRPAAGVSDACRNIKNYTDFPETVMRQIEHFCHYKDVDPGKWPNRPLRGCRRGEANRCGSDRKGEANDLISRSNSRDRTERTPCRDVSCRLPLRKRFEFNRRPFTVTAAVASACAASSSPPSTRSSGRLARNLLSTRPRSFAVLGFRNLALKRPMWPFQGLRCDDRNT